MLIGRRGSGAATLALTLAACGSPSVGPATPPITGPAMTFTDISQQIIAPRCATSACHSGEPPAFWPQLDAEVAYAQIVDVPSQQVPTMSLVAPFAPADSYLLLRLRGNGADAGGLAGTMPPNDPLDDASIASIEAWIANGAPND
jgi:hypothetical protein